MSGFTYDVIIIGGGVAGCAVARELARYRARIALLERAEDVCSGASKANSGIVHAGFDAAPGPPKRASTCWATGRWARWPASLTLNSRAAARWCSALTRRTARAWEALRRAGGKTAFRGWKFCPATRSAAVSRWSASAAWRRSGPPTGRHRLPVRAHDRPGRERLRQRRDLFAADRGHGHRAHGGRLPRGDRPRRADGPLRRQCGRGLCRCAAQPGQRPQAAHHAAQRGITACWTKRRAAMCAAPSSSCRGWPARACW